MSTVLARYGDGWALAYLANLHRAQGSLDHAVSGLDPAGRLMTSEPGSWRIVGLARRYPSRAVGAGDTAWELARRVRHPPETSQQDVGKIDRHPVDPGGDGPFHETVIGDAPGATAQTSPPDLLNDLRRDRRRPE